MPAIGLLMILMGGYLLDCAVRNVGPWTTFRTLLTDPSSAEKALTSHGSTFVVNHGGTTDGNSAVGGNAGVAPANAATGTPVVSNAAAGIAISYARAQIGKPYRWGTTGPATYDCSGLVMKAYQQAGINLPRTTALMVLKGSSVSKANLQPGDLVFPDPGHVQIYTGNGMIVEAPRTGEKVREVPMWGFWTARRVATATHNMGGKQ